MAPVKYDLLPLVFGLVSAMQYMWMTLILI